MNTLVSSETRTGKSFGQLGRIEREESAVVVCDPQRSISIELAKRCDNVLYDRIALTDRALGFINLPSSKNPDQLQRMREDYDARMLLARPALERQGAEAATSPLKWEMTEFALKLIQYSGSPLYWIPFCFEPSSMEFKYMLSLCTDARTRAKAIEISFFSRIQLRNECSPALRLWEPICTDPCFMARCGNTDLGQLIRDGRKIIFEGYQANSETVRTLMLFIIMRVITFCEKNNVPVHLVIDEASNWDLVTKDVVTALGTLQKQHLDITIICQTVASFDETVQRMLMQNCQRREYFRCGYEMAALAAKDICTPQLDPMKFSHSDSRRRQVHDGYDHEGKSQYGEISEEIPHYFTFSDQEKLIQQDIMTLPVGTRWVNERGRVFKERVKLVEDKLPWNLTEIRTEKKIAQVRQGSEFQTPRLIGVPENFVPENLSQSTRRPSGKSNGLQGSRVMKPANGQSGNGNGKGSSNKSGQRK